MNKKFFMLSVIAFSFAAVRADEGSLEKMQPGNNSDQQESGTNGGTGNGESTPPAVPSAAAASRYFSSACEYLSKQVSSGQTLCAENPKATLALVAVLSSAITLLAVTKYNQMCADEEEENIFA